jgi:hypothetical protein
MASYASEISAELKKVAKQKIITGFFGSGTIGQAISKRVLKKEEDDPVSSALAEQQNVQTNINTTIVRIEPIVVNISDNIFNIAAVWSKHVARMEDALKFQKERLSKEKAAVEEEDNEERAVEAEVVKKASAGGTDTGTDDTKGGILGSLLRGTNKTRSIIKSGLANIGKFLLASAASAALSTGAVAVTTAALTPAMLTANEQGAPESVSYNTEQGLVSTYSGDEEGEDISLDYGDAATSMMGTPPSPPVNEPPPPPTLEPQEGAVDLGQAATDMQGTAPGPQPVEIPSAPPPAPTLVSTPPPVAVTATPSTYGEPYTPPSPQPIDIPQPIRNNTLGVRAFEDTSDTIQAQPSPMNDIGGAAPVTPEQVRPQQEERYTTQQSSEVRPERQPMLSSSTSSSFNDLMNQSTTSSDRGDFKENTSPLPPNLSGLFGSGQPVSAPLEAPPTFQNMFNQAVNQIQPQNIDTGSTISNMTMMLNNLVNAVRTDVPTPQVIQSSDASVLNEQRDPAPIPSPIADRGSLDEGTTFDSAPSSMMVS